MLSRSPESTLFPYTTLFRSGGCGAGRRSIRFFKLNLNHRLMLDRFGLVLISDHPNANGNCQSCCERRPAHGGRSEEHTSELQSRRDLVCRLLLEKKKKNINY